MASLAARERRILTTHAGSLPRRASLSALLFARMSKKPFDAEALDRETRDAVAETVRKQRARHRHRQRRRAVEDELPALHRRPAVRPGVDHPESRRAADPREH